MASTQEAKYAQDEKVLCKHGLCFYPAKILEVDQTTDSTEDGYRYFVHYQGWNPKWDEWVGDDRLDKFTDGKAKAAADEQKKITEQFRKKKGSGGGSSKSSNKAHSESDRASIASSVADNSTLKDVELGSRGSSPSVDSTVSSSATMSTNAGGGGGTPATTNTSSTSTSRKPRTKSNKSAGITPASGTSVAQQPESKKRKFRASDAVQSSTFASNQTQSGPSATGTSSLFVQSEQDYLTRPEVCVKLPEDLRPLLVDDWDLVVQQMKLVRLPAKLTVAQIFQEYVREKRALKNISAAKFSQIVESAEGLCAYFDVMLPCQLLYKFEKPQYDDLYRKNPDFLPSECYGFIHLVRLFVRLGHMLACTALDEKNMSVVLTGVTEFLKYLKMIKPQNVSSDYETATPEYQRLAYS